MNENREYHGNDGARSFKPLKNYPLNSRPKYAGPHSHLYPAHNRLRKKKLPITNVRFSPYYSFIK